MVSNDERRLAAATLRMFADKSDTYSPDWDIRCAVCMPTGDWRSLYKKLADLIDRPPCEPLFYEPNETGDGFVPSDRNNATFVQCGNCGARLHWASAYDNPLPRYCHNCGAEVER